MGLSGSRASTRSSRTAPRVTLGPQPSPLIDSAVELLADGPVDSATLVARVCHLPAVPSALADHLATALLAADGRFVRRFDGRWALVGAIVDAAPVASGFLDRESYVVVDVETTGTSPLRGDRVTEVAVVLVRGNERTLVFDSLVNPERAIPQQIVALTHITWEMVKNAPRFADIAAELAGVLEGHVFVAHNAAFDWRFISAEMERATGRPLLGRRLCTVRLARAFLPTLRRRSLDYVADHFGIANHARHRAGGDAVATAQILSRLLMAARDAGCNTIDDVDLHCSLPGRRRRRGRPSALPHAVTVDTTA